jgi:hypothetical protein
MYSTDGDHRVEHIRSLRNRVKALLDAAATTKASMTTTDSITTKINNQTPQSTTTKGNNEVQAAKLLLLFHHAPHRVPYQPPLWESAAEDQISCPSTMSKIGCTTRAFRSQRQTSDMT